MGGIKRNPYKPGKIKHKPTIPEQSLIPYENWIAGSLMSPSPPPLFAGRPCPCPADRDLPVGSTLAVMTNWIDSHSELLSALGKQKGGDCARNLKGGVLST